jgi:hypothetical protein
MEKRLGQKLGSLLGFVLFGFLLFLGFYHFSQRFASQHSIHNQLGSADRANAFPNENRSTEAADGRYVLHLDQSQTIGKVNLVYRGLEGNSICLIDVIIPDLDPERPYKYRLDIETAEKGFRMAGYNFKLETTGKNYIRLVEAAPGNQ